MTALVTGGAGFIGSHLALELARRNVETVILDDLSAGFRWLVPPNCIFVKGELSNRELLDNLMKMYRFDAIFHFAAKVVVPDSILDPLTYYRSNLIGSQILIESAISHGVKYFVFSSTAAVYGDAFTGIVSESSELQPLSPYGRSKLAVEWILKDAANASDIKFIIFRYFNVAGADPDCLAGQSSPNASHLIKVGVRAALGLNSSITVYGTDYPTRDGTCIRDYVHVSDLASAHILGLEYLKEGGESGVFNCGYGKGYSVLEVLESIRSVSGTNFSIQFSERRSGDPVALIAQADAVKETLGWKPKFDSIDTIVKHSLIWEKHLLGMPKT